MLVYNWYEVDCRERRLLGNLSSKEQSHFLTACQVMRRFAAALQCDHIIVIRTSKLLMEWKILKIICKFFQS